MRRPSSSAPSSTLLAVFIVALPGMLGGCDDASADIPFGFDGTLATTVDDMASPVNVTAGSDGKGTVEIGITVVNAGFDETLVAEVSLDASSAHESLPAARKVSLELDPNGDDCEGVPGADGVSCHAGATFIAFDRIGRMVIRTTLLGQVELDEVIVDAAPSSDVTLEWADVESWNCYPVDAADETLLSPVVSVTGSTDGRVTWEASLPGVLEQTSVELEGAQVTANLIVPAGLTGEQAKPIPISASHKGATISRVISAQQVCD